MVHLRRLARLRRLAHLRSNHHLLLRSLRRRHQCTITIAVITASLLLLLRLLLCLLSKRRVADFCPDNKLAFPGLDFETGESMNPSLAGIGPEIRRGFRSDSGITSNRPCAHRSEFSV